jgi:hypothetical protein
MPRSANVPPVTSTQAARAESLVNTPTAAFAAMRARLKNSATWLSSIPL